MLSRSPPPALDLDLALREPAWPDDDLPGQADEVGGGELGARALVAIVVEHAEAGGLQAVWISAQAASVAASPVLRLISATSKGATESGQMMRASSWEASMMAATSRLGPIP